MASLQFFRKVFARQQQIKIIAAACPNGHNHPKERARAFSGKIGTIPTRDSKDEEEGKNEKSRFRAIAGSDLSNCSRYYFLLIETNAIVFDFSLVYQSLNCLV